MNHVRLRVRACLRVLGSDPTHTQLNTPVLWAVQTVQTGTLDYGPDCAILDSWKDPWTDALASSMRRVPCFCKISPLSSDSITKSTQGTRTRAVLATGERSAERCCSLESRGGFARAPTTPSSDPMLAMPRAPRTEEGGADKKLRTFTCFPLSPALCAGFGPASKAALVVLSP